ncbi:unnamed protein product [Caenorhabditis brenneri]
MEDIDLFRLLDLPVLVLVRILRKMRFVDLFILAQHHPSLKQLIKTEVKRHHNYALCIQYHGSLAFEFVNLKEEYSAEFIKSEPKSRMRPRHRVYTNWELGKSNRFPCRFRQSSPRDRSVFVTHWKDPFKGARELYKGINDLFSLPIWKVQVKLDRIQETYKPFFRWIHRIGPNIPKIEVYGKNVDFQAYTWVMEHVKPSERLAIPAEPYEYFKKGTLNVDVQEVCIEYGRWVSVDNLLAMKSKNIAIIRSILSAEDLNRFLHRFKKGSNPNLNKLTIVYRPDWFPDTEECFQGLNLTEIDGEFNEWLFELDNGDEGMIAIVNCPDEEEEGLQGFEIMEFADFVSKEELESLREYSVRQKEVKIKNEVGISGNAEEREAKMTPEEREAMNRKRRAKEVSDKVAAKRARKEKKQREARKRLGNPFLNPNYFVELGQPIFQEDYSDEEDDEMEENSDDVQILRADEQKIMEVLEEPEPVYYTLKKRPRKATDEAEILEIPRVDLKRKKTSDDEMTQKIKAESANSVQKAAPKRCRGIADEPEAVSMNVNTKKCSDDEFIQKIKAEIVVKVEKPQQKLEQVPGKKLSRYQRLSPEERKIFNKRKTDAKRLKRQQMKREAMAAEEQLNNAPVNNNAYYQDENDENQMPKNEYFY